MNLNKEHFREIIFYDFKVGLSATECHDQQSGIQLCRTLRTARTWVPAIFSFPTVQKLRFEHKDEAVTAFEKVARALPDERYSAWFDDRFIQMQKCIDAEGEYL